MTAAARSAAEVLLERLLTIAEETHHPDGAHPIGRVAELLGISRDTVEGLIATGAIGVLDRRLFPGRTLIPTAELRRFITENTVRTPVRALTSEEEHHAHQDPPRARNDRGRSRPRHPDQRVS